MAAILESVFIDLQSLLRLRPCFLSRDQQVHAAVAIEIIGDDVARILFEGDSRQVANLNERFAALVEVKPVLLVAAIGPAVASSAAEFIHQVTGSRHIINALLHEDIVQPKLGLVIPHRLLALEAVGNIDVWKSVIVEVEHAATPGPAGAGERIAQVRLFEPFIGPRKVKTVSEGHRWSPQAIP